MMWTLFLLLLPSLSLCAPPISRELKPCDDSGPRVSQLSLDSALSTFLCFTEEEIGAMEEVDKKRKLAQTIAPLVSSEHSYEDLVRKIIKVPSDSLVKIVNEVMNNRNAENGPKTIDEYGAVFDEHRHLNNGLEDLNRKGRIAFLSNLESWFSLGEGLDDSPNTAPPQILTPSQTFRVSVGDSVILPCSVHDLGTLVPLWKYKEHILTAGRQMVNPDSFKYQLVNDYNLQIRNVRALDAGDYTCFIATFGRPVTLTHTIKILSLGTSEETPSATKIAVAKESTTKIAATTSKGIDGSWTDFSDWSGCSKTCGVGEKVRSRTCTNPSPSDGGKDCVGQSMEVQSCVEVEYCPECDGNWENDVEYSGHDILSCKDNKKSSPAACQELCKSTSGCVGWEWGFDGDNCCVKSKLEDKVQGKEGRIAGKRNSCQQEKLWRDDGRCGDRYPLRNGQPGQCDPTANADGEGPCCDSHGWCGNSDAHCKCLQCVNYAGYKEISGPVCPKNDDLSGVLKENKWRTEEQITAMSEEQKRNAVIVELAKMTGHQAAELLGRCNAGDLGSLTSIANIAALLIEYSIKCISDVKTMTYEPDLRNTLIFEINKRFSIDVGKLQSMNDNQLLKTFSQESPTTGTPSRNKCAGCPTDEILKEECMCGFCSCAKGSLCASSSRSTCISSCPADETITSECLCGDERCAKGRICISGSTCTVINSDCVTAETIMFGSRIGEPFYIEPVRLEDIKNIKIRTKIHSHKHNYIEGLGMELVDGSKTPFHQTSFAGPKEIKIFEFQKENPNQIKVEWLSTNNYFGNIVTSLIFINTEKETESTFGGEEHIILGRSINGQINQTLTHAFSSRKNQTINITCKLGFHGHTQENGISLAIITGCDGEWEFDVEYSGYDLVSCHENRKTSPQACQRFCQTNPECVGWEWGYDGNNCCVKSDLKNQKTGVKGRVSGKRRSCQIIRDCTDGEITSDACLCKARESEKEETCQANHKSEQQKCNMDEGTCSDGCLIEEGVVYTKFYSAAGPYFFPPTHYPCTGLKFLPEIRKLKRLLESERRNWQENGKENTSGDEAALLEIMDTTSTYFNDCRVKRSCEWRTIFEKKEKIESKLFWINLTPQQVSSGFLERFDPAFEKIQENAHSLTTIKDCPYYETYKDGDCMCDEHKICAKTQVCARGYCYENCKKDDSIVEKDCFCNNIKTEKLIFCMKGNRCLSDGHCHYGYKVSGVPTSQVTTSNTSTLWTHKIIKVTQELNESILFRPEDLVGEATIQLSSPNDATVFLLLNEDKDSIWMKELLPKGWGFKAEADEKWVVETENLTKKRQTMWYTKIKANEPVTFTIRGDGAAPATDRKKREIRGDGVKYAFFFATECPLNKQLHANCYCKNAGKFCRTGQECSSKGICNNLVLAVPLF